MALYTPCFSLFLTSLVFPFLILRSYSFVTNIPNLVSLNDDPVEFSLNLEFLEAEFFLSGAIGKGLDDIAPELAQGGPPPIGGKMANLDPFTKDIIYQFALEEIGHIRAIKNVVKGFPRPLLNISKEQFAVVIDQAFEQPLNPPFDAYANPINFLIAVYLIPYVGLTGYVGAIPQLQSVQIKELVAGLLGVEAGQDAIIRALLYQRKDLIVIPYGVNVANFTDKISKLRNKLGKEGIKDEGLIVPPSQGAEGKVSGNVLSADKNSLSYARTPKEILGIIYGTGDEHVRGGFFPQGANGRIAKSYLNGGP